MQGEKIIVNLFGQNKKLYFQELFLKMLNIHSLPQYVKESLYEER